MAGTDRYTVIVIDRDMDAAKSIVEFINDLGNGLEVDGVASTFESGYELVLKKKPKVLIMDIGTDVELAIQRIQAVISRMPQVMIFATSEDKSSDTILRIMRAGADEYLVRPVSREDITAALQKHGRLWVSEPSSNEEGKIITFFSPKGGVGTTTLAINIAANLVDLTQKETIVLDLDLDAGDVCTFLNLEPHYTIGDITVNMSRLDLNFLKGVIVKHDSGVHVLAEPHRMTEVKSIKGGDIKKILGLLKSMYSFIVIDLHPVYDECSSAVFEVSDQIFLPFVLSLPGLKNMQKYLQFFKEYDVETQKLKILISRYLKKGEIAIEDAEKILGHKIFQAIPNEYDTAIDCLNKGEPLRMCHERSRLNASLIDLTKNIIKLIGKGA